jgi:hypothetical protein
LAVVLLAAAAAPTSAAEVKKTAQELVAALDSDDPQKVSELFGPVPELARTQIEFHGMPLAYCMKNMKLKSAAALLGCKADPGIKDEFGKPMLHVLFLNKKVYRAGAGEIEALLGAFARGKADFNMFDGEGHNLIHCILLKNRSNREDWPGKAEGLIELLIKTGTDPKARLKDERKTPLLSAVIRKVYRRKNKDGTEKVSGLPALDLCIRLYQKHGLSFDEEDSEKETPLMALLDDRGDYTEEKLLETAVLLVRNGADINSRSKSGLKPIKMASDTPALEKAMKEAKRSKPKD